MKNVDTNILIRFILRDHEEFSPLARHILQTNECHLLPEVIPEIVYVLNKAYGFKRQAVAQAILHVLPLVVVKDTSLVRLALHYFSRCILITLTACCWQKNKLHGHEIITFDKKLKKNLESLPPVSVY